MLLPVQADVPLQVILEVLQPAARCHVQLVHDALKNGGQQVFPTERERRGDGTEVAAVDDVEGLPDETADAFGCADRFEGGCNRLAFDWTFERARGDRLSQLVGHRAGYGRGKVRKQGMIEFAAGELRRQFFRINAGQRGTQSRRDH
jgi:hypothetical protein